MKVFSIKNEKIGFFNRPIYCESSNEALTYLQNVLMSDADRVMYGLRDDLALYELGEVDFVTGVIRGYRKPEKVCGLADIFASVPSDSIPRTESELRKEIENMKEAVKKLLEEKRGDCIAECCEQ